VPSRFVPRTNPHVTAVVDFPSPTRTRPFWPHFTIDPVERRQIQHFSLHHGCLSLIDAQKAGVLTNQAHAIQIEIVATRAQGRRFGEDEHQFIRDMMLRIDSIVPIPRRSGLRFLDQGGATNSLSDNAWLRFSGWCGHQHTPLAKKPCPGPLRIDRLVAPNQ
jgi:hypothetical protein